MLSKKSEQTQLPQCGRLNERFIELMENLSDIMLKQGEPFRARAYQKAQETIMSYPDDILGPDDLKGKPGIGYTIMEKFNEYQVEKNKLFCKDLNIEFGDGTKWTVKILDVLYIKNSLEGIDPDIIDLDDSLLHDDVLMIKWIEKNVKWEDISSYAELVKTDEKEAYRTKNFKQEKKTYFIYRF
jgi:DNA polymerase/3'-5' exonuclease PolX